MRIRMIGGVLGEDGTSWSPGTEHEATEEFGRWLVARQKAVALTELPPDPGIIDSTAVEKALGQSAARDPRVRRR
jgi:hypothetical protein